MESEAFFCLFKLTPTVPSSSFDFLGRIFDSIDDFMCKCLSFGLFQLYASNVSAGWCFRYGFVYQSYDFNERNRPISLKIIEIYDLIK